MKLLNSMRQQRDITFDIMKGIGIVLVLLGHVWSEYTPYMYQFIYSFHMPMFFLVAGYFSKAYIDMPTTKRAIKGYFRRLCVPAIITQICIILFSILNKYGKGVSWNDTIVKTLALFWADIYGPVTPWGKLGYGVIWFLVALFVSKCLLLPLSRLGKWTIPVSFALAVVSLLVHGIFPYSIWCISIAFMALPFVSIGWWCKNHTIPVWVKVLCIVCWPIAIVFSGMDMYDFYYQCYPLDVLGACGGTLCLYYLCRWLKKMHEKKHISMTALMQLGQLSLIIMCVHCFEMAAHLGSHMAALFHLNLSVGWMYVFRYVLTIVIAILINQIISFVSRWTARVV